MDRLLLLARDSAWQLPSALLALLALLVPIVIYLKQRSIKELSFGLVRTQRMLTVADALSKRVTVYFDGESVGDVHALLFALRNSGHQAVLADDFVEPLSISFEGGTVLDASVTDLQPKQIAANISIEGDRVIFAPLLINPGEQILITVLLSAKRQKYDFNYRIVGISKLANVREAVRKKKLSTVIFLNSAVAVGAGFLFNDPPRGSDFYLSIAILFLVLLAIDLVPSMVRQGDRRRVVLPSD